MLLVRPVAAVDTLLEVEIDAAVAAVPGNRIQHRRVEARPGSPSARRRSRLWCPRDRRTPTRASVGSRIDKPCCASRRERKDWVSSQLTVSTGRCRSTNALGLLSSPMTAVHNAWVTGVAPIQNPRVSAHFDAGATSLSRRPGSSSGDPIIKVPGGIQNIRYSTSLTAKATHGP